MTIIDIHSHIGTSIFGYGQTPKELLQRMDNLGISHAVICPVQPQTYHLGPENDRIAQAVEQQPNRFLGFCRVDPRQRNEATKELRRCIQKLGLKGLFIHPWEETCPINDPLVKQLVAVAAELEIPVMLSGGHVRVSRAFQINDLVSLFPQTPFIVTSGGQLNISGVALHEAEILLSENQNVYLETSGIYREDFIEDMVAKIGNQRVVFGSNSPQYDLRLEILRVRRCHLDEKAKAAIQWENTARILKLIGADKLE